MLRNKTFRYSIFGFGLLTAGFLSAFFIDNDFSATSYYQRASAYLGSESLNKNNENINEGIFGVIFGNEKSNSSKAGEALKNSLKKIGESWSGTGVGSDSKTIGLTMFRGSPTRTFYGLGPLPADPKVLWRYPEKPMCSFSEAEGVTKQWCGSGWTGQPVVWERPDGITEVIFGAYDGAVHFVNAKTGKDTRPKFQTGDLIKGSITLDPDGYPLIYFGSRDNKLRIVALDREVPTELWALNADEVIGKWNNDWDGNPVVVNDFLFEGGENSWFFTMKINRSYVADENPTGNSVGNSEKIGTGKKVAVAPTIVFKIPGWTDELLKNIGDNTVSIESSVTFFGDRVYFANSGGRIVGLDISKIDQGIAPIVFDYWVGDDVDATIVTDEKGMLYISAELERMNERSAELGQFIKLDPYRQKIDYKTITATAELPEQTVAQISGDPYLWGVDVPKDHMSKGGIWATPALYGNYLYVATHTGNLLTVDRETGSVTNKDFIGVHAWSSPVVISDGNASQAKLLVATCSPGGFKQYDLSNPAIPKLTNTMLHAGGACIESTPAVWKGQIFVGTRDGYFYSFADKQ